MTIFQMKKLLYFVLLFTAPMFMACGENTPATPEEPKTPKLVLCSERIMPFDAEGGSGIISYRIDNPSLEYNLVVECENQEWLSDVDYSRMGEIRFVVHPNTTSYERDAVIKAKYGSQSFSVSIVQSAEIQDSVTVDANQLWGTYIDDNRLENSAIYWIILSHNGFDEQGATVANSTYYRMELVAPKITAGAKLAVPDGEYSYDTTNSMLDYTFTGLNSGYVTLDINNISTAYPFDYATLIVDGNKFILDASVDGVRHHVTFDQEYELIIQENNSNQISTLREDVVVDFKNTTVYAESYDDYWGCGYCNWWIEIMPNGTEWNGVNLIIDIISTSPYASDGFEGTYLASGFVDEEMTEPIFGPGLFVSGVKISDEGHLMGSVYLRYENDILVDQAPLTTGAFSIVDNGDGTHSLTLEAYDDAAQPHKITANWTGVVQMR